MHFACLGSGSRGNAWLVAAGTTRVLVDCGFSATETLRRLARLDCAAEALDAVIVTHEHGDHVAGAGPLARRLGVPVWLTHGTHDALRDRAIPDLCFIEAETPFAVGDLEFTPFAVPHDAREPVQFTVSDGARRLGMLTDLGSLTAHVERALADCDALVLEANHDLDLLLGGAYPPALKRRVSGAHGHLDNTTSAELLGRLDTARLQHLVAAHLSEQNNTPELAAAAFAAVLGCRPGEVTLADQADGLGWREIAG